MTALDDTIHNELMEMYLLGWRHCAERMFDLTEANEETKQLYSLLMAGKEER